AVVVEGMGKSPDQAIKNALQQAVEEALGTVVRSRSLVESGNLIRDDVLTHARGYVSAYKILRKTSTPDGAFFVELDAQVNAGRIQDHAQAMEILMKMSGQPKVLVFAISDDIASIPTATANFPTLTKSVIEAFNEKFRFSVLDLDTVRAKLPDFTGELTRQKALKMAPKVGADFLVMVKVNAERRGAGVRGGLILEAVRASDAHFLGKETTPFQFWQQDDNEQRFTQSAVNRAERDVFGLSLQLATKIVRDMQGETDGGTGFRYALSFIGFPPDTIEPLFKGELDDLTGYVRHEINQQQQGLMKVSYWSHLKGDELMPAMRRIIGAKGAKFQTRLNGRSLKFKWVHPLFE
ncbi:MAG: hypothetical protein HQL53_09490, partial [Magnetococcales bacterium]|nr:hypothetical protein [Magnetococcales bacterium]